MDKNKEQLAKSLEKRVELVNANMTLGKQWAVTLCAESFPLGGNWGMISSSNREFGSILNSLLEEKENVKAYKVANGALVLVDITFMVNCVNSYIPNAINTNYISDGADRKRTEAARVNNLFWEYLKKTKKPIIKDGLLTIGVCCTNKVDVMGQDDKDYPAFRLSVAEFLFVLQGFSQHIQTQNQMKAGNFKTPSIMTDKGLVPVDKLNPADLRSVYAKLKISTARTGVFIEIAM